MCRDYIFHFMPARNAASPLWGTGRNDTITESWNICIFIVILEENKSLRNHRSCQSIHRSSPNPANVQVVRRGICFQFMPERRAACPLRGAGGSDTTTESWNVCISISIGEENKSLRNHRSCQSIHRLSPNPTNFQVVCSGKILEVSIPIQCAAFPLLHGPLVSNVEPFEPICLQVNLQCTVQNANVVASRMLST